MFQINLNDPNAKLRDLVDAALKGEDIVIVTEDGSTIKLIPAPTPKRPHYGSAEGLFEMADDFNAPLEDFKDYIP